MKAKHKWTPERTERFRATLAAKRAARVDVPSAPRITFEPAMQPERLTPETLDLAWDIAKVIALRMKNGG